MKTKNIYFFCTIIIAFFAFNAYSQSYIPLLQHGNQWNVLRDAANPTVYTKIFKIDIDTVIGGKQCVKLVSSNDSSSMANYHFSNYMYEDTITKKIYTFDNQLNMHLYFDFNAQVGDSLFLFDPFSGISTCDTFIVSNIENIMIDNLNRKKFTMSYLSNNIQYPNCDNWIEGIGSSRGIIYGAVNPLWVGSPYKLLCLKNSDHLVYQNANYCYFTNVGIEDNEKNSVLVYPNSVKDMLIIDNVKNMQIKVYDLLGRLQIQKNLTEGNNQIVCSNLTAGIYNIVI
ncbi:MAG: T9SS type A sorting domain-containing protein [Bacteroidota bacterium]